MLRVWICLFSFWRRTLKVRFLRNQLLWKQSHLTRFGSICLVLPSVLPLVRSLKNVGDFPPDGWTKGEDWEGGENKQRMGGGGSGPNCQQHALSVGGWVGGMTTSVRRLGPTGTSLEHLSSSEDLDPDQNTYLDLSGGAGLTWRRSAGSSCSLLTLNSSVSRVFISQ